MLAYYLDKIRATAQTQIQGRQYKTAPGIYNGFLGEGSELQTEVYLGIWNPRLFHLGDQLFYIPLFKYLIDEGYSVNIVGDSGLAPLFEELGCRCISIETFRNLDTRGAIVLSKADLITETQKLANNSFFIGFDYGRMEGAAPVAELILENTRSLL